MELSSSINKNKATDEASEENQSTSIEYNASNEYNQSDAAHTNSHSDFASSDQDSIQHHTDLNIDLENTEKGNELTGTVALAVESMRQESDPDDKQEPLVREEVHQDDLSNLSTPLQVNCQEKSYLRELPRSSTSAQASLLQGNHLNNVPGPSTSVQVMNQQERESKELHSASGTPQSNPRPASHLDDMPTLSVTDPWINIRSLRGPSVRDKPSLLQRIHLYNLPGPSTSAKVNTREERSLHTLLSLSSQRNELPVPLQTNSRQVSHPNDIFGLSISAQWSQHKALPDISTRQRNHVNDFPGPSNKAQTDSWQKIYRLSLSGPSTSAQASAQRHFANLTRPSTPAQSRSSHDILFDELPGPSGLRQSNDLDDLPSTSAQARLRRWQQGALGVRTAAQIHQQQLRINSSFSARVSSARDLRRVVSDMNMERQERFHFARYSFYNLQRLGEQSRSIRNLRVVENGDLLIFPGLHGNHVRMAMYDPLGGGDRRNVNIRNRFLLPQMYRLPGGGGDFPQHGINMNLQRNLNNFNDLLDRHFEARGQARVVNIRATLRHHPVFFAHVPVVDEPELAPGDGIQNDENEELEGIEENDDDDDNVNANDGGLAAWWFEDGAGDGPE